MSTLKPRGSERAKYRTQYCGWDQRTLGSLAPAYLL